MLELEANRNSYSVYYHYYYFMIYRRFYKKKYIVGIHAITVYLVTTGKLLRGANAYSLRSVHVK